MAKHCCPCCGAFLSILMNGLGENVVVQGNNDRIFPCAILPWTSSNIVDMMNTMFGGLLLQDLVALKSEGVGQFSEIGAGLLALTPCQSKVLRVVCSSPMNSPIPHNVTLLVWVIGWLL